MRDLTTQAFLSSTVSFIPASNQLLPCADGGVRQLRAQLLILAFPPLPPSSPYLGLSLQPVHSIPHHVHCRPDSHRENDQTVAMETVCSPMHYTSTPTPPIPLLLTSSTFQAPPPTTKHLHIENGCLKQSEA
jgi:hypothetical protein